MTTVASTSDAPAAVGPTPPEHPTIKPRKHPLTPARVATYVFLTFMSLLWISPFTVSPSLHVPLGTAQRTGTPRARCSLPISRARRLQGRPLKVALKKRPSTIVRRESVVRTKCYE